MTAEWCPGSLVPGRACSLLGGAAVPALPMRASGANVGSVHEQRRDRQLCQSTYYVVVVLVVYHGLAQLLERRVHTYGYCTE